MKYSKLNEDERKVWSNEACKVRQKVHVGFNHEFTPFERELIDYMELYEALQNRKRTIYDKYLKEAK